MKKMFSVVLVVLSLLSIAACGKNKTEAESLVGAWEAESELSVLGIALPDADEKQTVDMVYRFEFNEDGTGERQIIVDEKYSKYVQDVNASFNYSYDGDKLELTYDDGTIQAFSVTFSDEKLILDGRARIELSRTK